MERAAEVKAQDAVFKKYVLFEESQAVQFSFRGTNGYTSRKIELMHRRKSSLFK